MARYSKPDEVRAALGNIGKRKIKRNRQAKPPKDAWKKFAPPFEFVTATAKKIWGDLAPDLVSMNFLKPTDSHPFFRYCEYWSDWLALTEQLNREGFTQDVPMSTVEAKMTRRHPSFGLRKDVENSLIAFEDRYGLNPLARQKMLRDQAGLPPGSLFDFNRESESSYRTDETGVSPLLSPIGILNTTEQRLN